MNVNFSKFLHESIAPETDSWKPSTIPLIRPSFQPAPSYNNAALTPVTLCPALKEASSKPKQKLALRAQNPAPSREISTKNPLGVRRTKSRSQVIPLLSETRRRAKNALDSLFESTEKEAIAKDKIIDAIASTTHLKTLIETITAEQAKTLQALLSKIITLVEDKNCTVFKKHTSFRSATTGIMSFRMACLNVRGIAVRSRSVEM
ncbi:hypothetical protein LAZ67_X001496 [Cordylochernes scorpioides]|uniref:Uncharacterized protein n=1 Tax=Cordylochernes scorpioides TaxID=51811 RepID=A0ABY6LSR6_9ARAC|nr:hypothetical protein LAZ67_X001496 [Cordylochernes scorpioides]